MRRDVSVGVKWINVNNATAVCAGAQEKGYFLLTLLLLVVEVLIALYVRDAVVRPHGGDFLVVMLIYCFLRTFVDRSPLTLALATLAFAFAVEFAQLFHLVDLL